MGYASEALRVYNKANELCKRLNSEQTRIEKPPKWLQKQYSVPRPKSLVIIPDPSRLDPSRVRRLREQLMRKMLQPLGFVKAPDATYVRKINDQYHLINFQASKYGGSYTINLGFHYTFIPTFHNPKPAHLLDCALQSRFGTKSDTWFDYGNNENAFKALLARNLNQCVGILDNYSELWKEPLFLLKSLSLNRAESIKNWHGKKTLFLVCLAIHLRQFEIAEKQLARLKDANLHVNQWYNSILRRLTNDKRFLLS